MMQIKTLAAIAKEYGTDKLVHGYCDHYEKRFAEMRDMPITLLEIGIAQGASLRMWQHYFLRARIVGIDIAPQVDASMSYLPKAIEVGDQADVAFLERCCEKYAPFDIVVDDGSHVASDQIASFTALWPSVVPGGWYVIEDLHMLFDSPQKNPPGTRTMLDVLFDRRRDILIGVRWDAKEVHLVGGPHNDGMVFIRKATKLA
jgi:hypothetical protein